MTDGNIADPPKFLGGISHHSKYVTDGNIGQGPRFYGGCDHLPRSNSRKGGRVPPGLWPGGGQIRRRCKRLMSAIDVGRSMPIADTTPFGQGNAMARQFRDARPSKGKTNYDRWQYSAWGGMGALTWADAGEPLVTWKGRKATCSDFPYWKLSHLPMRDYPSVTSKRLAGSMRSPVSGSTGRALAAMVRARSMRSTFLPCDAFS